MPSVSTLSSFTKVYESITDSTENIKLITSISMRLNNLTITILFIVLRN